MRNKYGKINQTLNNSVDPVTHDQINTNHSVPTVVQIISNKTDIYIYILFLLSVIPLFHIHTHNFNKFISLNSKHIYIFPYWKMKIECLDDSFDYIKSVSAQSTTNAVMLSIEQLTFIGNKMNECLVLSVMYILFGFYLSLVTRPDLLKVKIFKKMSRFGRRLWVIVCN